MNHHHSSCILFFIGGPQGIKIYLKGYFLVKRCTMEGVHFTKLGSAGELHYLVH